MRQSKSRFPRKANLKDMVTFLYNDRKNQIKKDEEYRKQQADRHTADEEELKQMRTSDPERFHKITKGLYRDPAIPFPRISHSTH